MPISFFFFNRLKTYLTVLFADLTFAATVPGKHGASNPNVLTEKGYALKAVGRDRILSVMNEINWRGY